MKESEITLECAREAHERWLIKIIRMIWIKQ